MKKTHKFDHFFEYIMITFTSDVEVEDAKYTENFEQHAMLQMTHVMLQMTFPALLTVSYCTEN